MKANDGQQVTGLTTPASSREMVGKFVRVVTRRGAVVEGTCLDAWQLRYGGTALKIKPFDGSGPRELTTLQPIQLLDRPQNCRP